MTPSFHRSHPGASPGPIASVARLGAGMAALLWLLPCLSQEPLRRLDDALFFETPNGLFSAELSGLLDLEGYYVDQKPPAILLIDDDFFFNPRLSLFLDAQLGDHLYSFVQFRVDRGFDPGGFRDGDVRFDEYLLRYTPTDREWFNVQIGKFATSFGNWVPRHLSWDNPMINAPLAYENITVVNDHRAPPSAAAFQGFKNRPAGDNKPTWLPVLWGPSYSSGGSVFGRIEKWDYAFEVKNVGIASRPYAWDADQVTWEYPNYTGRIGYHPGAAWTVGASASYGPFMVPPAEPTLPSGSNLGDFNQLTVGSDVRYSWRHLELWGEAIASRFEVPNVGDVETLVYYLEGKYQWHPRFHTALRWNQQFFDKVPDGTGGQQRWDRDIWRADVAVGYRFASHLAGKVQYSYSHQNGSIQQGEQMVAAQLIMKF